MSYIRKLKCLLRIHDEDLVTIKCIYGVVYPDGESIILPGENSKYIWQCKYCKKEKEFSE